jgi:hypothetical protein
MTKKPVKASTYSPAFYRNPRIFTFDFSTRDMSKCRPDWYRGITTNNILNDGQSLTDLLKKYPFESAKSENGDKNLQLIWQEIIVNKMKLDADKATKLLTHLSEYAHQFGYMHALKQGMAANLAKSNYVLDSTGSPSIMDFKVKKNKLIIEEKTQINMSRSVDKPFDETAAISSKRAGKPLCEGLLRHEISFNKAGEVQHRIAKLKLTANDPKIMKLLDSSTSKEKIIAFFKKMARTDLERTFRPKP